MYELTRASNLHYSLRRMDRIDETDIMDVYDILKDSMEIVKDYAIKHDIDYIINDSKGE